MSSWKLLLGRFLPMINKEQSNAPEQEHSARKQKLTRCRCEICAKNEPAAITDALLIFTRT